jgi:hypothetical protein
MDNEDDDLQAIQAREREIDAEMASLQQEREELAIAKRVMARLRGKSPGLSANGKSSPRPAGAPTNAEMVELVLADAEKEGKDGLTASELLQAISARYWPGLTGPQILPNIYGMAKRGRFRKTPSGKFKRNKES